MSAAEINAILREIDNAPCDEDDRLLLWASAVDERRRMRTSRPSWKRKAPRGRR